jgi:CHAD domain-containing protein
MTKRELELAPPGRFSSPRLALLPVPPSDPTMADALRAAIASALERLVEHDPLARLGEPEGVHQVRVALRRLRSDLRTLGDAVDPEWGERIQPRLRAIARALGEARDLDVLTDRLKRDADASASVLAPLFEHLGQRQHAARIALRDALDGPEYAALLAELVAAIRVPPTSRAAEQAARHALPRLAMSAWRRLERRAGSLRPDSPDAEFHRVRIAAKRARYAAELAARALHGDRARRAERFAKKIAATQDRLGALQDAAVAEDAIRATLDTAAHDGNYAFEAGRLAELQRQHASESRGAFLEAWPRLRRSKWRSWAS